MFVTQVSAEHLLWKQTPMSGVLPSILLFLVDAYFARYYNNNYYYYHYYYHFSIGVYIFSFFFSSSCFVQL